MSGLDDRSGVDITGVRWLKSRKKLVGERKTVEVMTYGQACEQVRHVEQLILRTIPVDLLRLREVARLQRNRIEGVEDRIWADAGMYGPIKRRRK
jgi:hypothetical protein